MRASGDAEQRDGEAEVPAASAVLSACLLRSCAGCVSSAAASLRSPPPLPLPMQREATVTAGKIAGLEAVRIIR